MWLSPQLWVICSQMPNAELPIWCLALPKKQATQLWIHGSWRFCLRGSHLSFPNLFLHWENGDNNGDSLQGLSGQSLPFHSPALTVSMEDASRGQPLIRADGQTGAWEKEPFFQVTQCQAPALYQNPPPCIVSLGEDQAEISLKKLPM